MSFGLNPYTNDVPVVSSFAGAVEAWRSIKPLRGSLASDPKPIGRRERRNPKQVRAELDPATGEPTRVIFRYHQTDVVTWHADDTCVIETYPSRSTTTFAACLLPRSVYLHGECSGLELLVPPTRERRCYMTNGQRITLRVGEDGFAMPFPDAEQPDGTQPVDHIKIDVKAANALYKRYRLREFKTFYNAFMATTNYEPSHDDRRIDTGPSRWRTDMVSPSDVLAILEAGSRDQWAGIARALAATEAFSLSQRVTEPMQLLRWMVWDAHQSEAYTITSVPYTHSYETLRRIEKSDPSTL